MIRVLAQARDAAGFGDKAVQLGIGSRAGLPVLDGFAVSSDHVDAVARGDADAVAALEARCSAVPCGRSGPAQSVRTRAPRASPVRT